jgi:teichuronic acid biosynthesis glycosyltransferase TuaC
MRLLAVTNMYPTPQHPASGTFVEQQVKGLQQIGLDVDVLFVDRLQNGMGVYRGLGRRIRAQVEKFRPDLVHVMYGGIMADKVTRSVTSCPSVVTFHGSDLLGEHLSGSLRKLIAGYGVYASWQAAKRANGVVVVSKVLQNALPEKVRYTKVNIIPCGIDLERFKPLDQKTCRAQLDWDDKIFHVLFPSHRENTVKRFGLACAAVDFLSRSGIQAELHDLQGVPNHEVPIWLNASNVLLLTSQHEGSPTVIKESLACNLPIVSVDVGDVRERIDGIDGCYLANSQPEDLSSKLREVYVRPCRIAGRDRVQELSLTRIAQRLQALYSEILTSMRK